MRLPLLNRQLVLEDSYRTPDGAGGYLTEWQPLGTIWGCLRAGSGREVSGQEMARSRVPVRIIVRAMPVGSPARPRAGQRLREGGRIFRIEAVADYHADGRFLVCHAEEEVAT